MVSVQSVSAGGQIDVIQKMYRYKCQECPRVIKSKDHWLEL
jgi:hypothetical protein